MAQAPAAVTPVAAFRHVNLHVAAKHPHVDVPQLRLAVVKPLVATLVVLLAVAANLHVAVKPLVATHVALLAVAANLHAAVKPLVALLADAANLHVAVKPLVATHVALLAAAANLHVAAKLLVATSVAHRLVAAKHLADVTTAATVAVVRPAAVVAC